METRTPNRLPFHRWAVFPVLLAQFVILLMATLALWWNGVVSGYSGLCGGLIALLPNVYFAQGFSVFRRPSGQAIVRSFYAGEAGKLILTAVLFALTFAGVKPLAPLAVFGVFVLTQLVSWFAPLLMNNKTFETLGRLRQPWQKNRFGLYPAPLAEPDLRSATRRQLGLCPFGSRSQGNGLLGFPPGYPGLVRRAGSDLPVHLPHGGQEGDFRSAWRPAELR
jgi:ATP synthase protein I